jgi:tetratricopeptide (TPR) repeat protein
LVAAIRSDLRHNEQAILTYQQVLDLVPDGKGLQIPPEELFTQYGAVLLNHGQSDTAVQVLEKSLASRPTPEAYYYLGNAHSQAGKTDAAEQAWQKSLQLDPGGVPVHEALANSALQKGDAEAAIKWLRPLERLAATRFKTAYLFQRVALKQKDLAGAQRWLKTLDELRKRDQVLTKVEDLMKRSPHSLWANVARAHQFASQGNWQQAADMIQELAHEAPDDPFVRELTEAIRQHGPLPPLERMPIK